MWTTPSTRIATWGLTAATAAVVLVMVLIAVARARGDMFGQRCRTAGHGLDDESVRRCIAQLASGKDPAPTMAADAAPGLKRKDSQ